jgi:hypothetical protein
VRLRQTCGRFPVWAEQLKGPLKDSRRSFDMTRLGISIQWQKSKQRNSLDVIGSSNASESGSWITDTSGTFIHSAGNTTPADHRPTPVTPEESPSSSNEEIPIIQPNTLEAATGLANVRDDDSFSHLKSQGALNVSRPDETSTAETYKVREWQWEGNEPASATLFAEPYYCPAAQNLLLGTHAGQPIAQYPYSLVQPFGSHQIAQRYE